MQKLILLYIALFFFVSCETRKESCQFDGAYEFRLSAELSPAKDTFNIDDTIYLSSNFDDKIYERKTGDEYHLEDFKFYPRLNLIHLDSMPMFLSLEAFEIVIDSVYDFHPFYLSDGKSNMIGEYKYSDRKYSLELKIIPKRSGLFLLSFGSALYPQDPKQEFRNKCSSKESEAFVCLNNCVDNNIDLLNLAADTAQINWIMQKPQDRYFDGGAFTFYVKR